MSSDLKKLHNPAIIGPGTWWFLHSACADAVTAEGKSFALSVIRHIEKKFTCNVCRKHFSEYIAMNPPERYADIVEGLLYWSIDAHNYANRLTGKPQRPYDEVRSYYLSPEKHFCSADCGQSADSNHSTPGVGRLQYQLRPAK